MPLGYEKRSPSHSHSNSVTSVSSQDSLPATLAIPSRPLSPTDRIAPASLGINTPLDLPTQRPMTGDPSRGGSGTATPVSNTPRTPPKAHTPSVHASAYGALSRSSTYQSTTSLVIPTFPSHLSTQPIHPFAGHPRLNDSVNSLPGFTPQSPIVRPTPSVFSESAFKAVHPPAQAFRHVSSPSSPMVRPGTAGGLSNLRTMSTEPQLGLGGRRTPSVTSGYAPAHHRGHSRSHSAGVIPFMYPSASSPKPPTRHSSRSSSSGSTSLPRSGLSHMRTVSDPDAIEVIAPTTRNNDMDMALRLERKLAEVQARLESNEGRSTADSSSYSGESSGSSIERVAPLSVIKKSKSAVDLGRSGESETEAFSRNFLLGGAGKLGGGLFGGKRGAPGG
jgi:hypothetical protein